MKGQEHPIGFPLWQGRQSVEHVASIGESWVAATEDYLVGALAYLPEVGKPEGQAAAAAELQRRLLLAVREFNAQSREQTNALLQTNTAAASQVTELVRLTTEAGRQGDKIIRLTWAVAGLTVVLGIIAGLQLWAMLVKGA